MGVLISKLGLEQGILREKWSKDDRTMDSLQARMGRSILYHLAGRSCPISTARAGEKAEVSRSEVESLGVEKVFLMASSKLQDL